MPKSAALEVFVGGRAAGRLERSEAADDTFLFSYLPGCASPDAVSLTMPVVPDQYDSMGVVHPIFEMNLPEGALLERLRGLFAKVVPGLDSLALLEIIGQSQIGRLRYALPGAVPAELPAEDLAALLACQGTAELFADLVDRYARHSGVSGIQPKVLLRAEGASLPRIAHRGATHIVKSFDARTYPELAANEYFCMRAAVHAGIPAARVQLADDRQILAVERLDLKPDGGYLGVEDFCVLNGLRSHGRYNGSYENIALRIRQFVSAQKIASALEQLFSMLALSCAVENGDAHLKNFAVTYEDAESVVQLAPAYDLVSTTPCNRRDVLALALGDSKAFPDRKRLVAFARAHCGLGSARTKELLGAVGHGVRQAISEIGDYVREHPDFREAGREFESAFKRGLSRLGL